MMRWGALLASLLSVVGVATASAQDAYPNRPVRVIVGLGAGSSTDVTARVIVQKMGQALGQTFVVENRTGAGGNIATGFVAQAAGDGYTLLFGSAATTVNVTLAPSSSFDLVRDLTPVALLATVPNILVVHPSLGVKTLDELIAKAKAKPDEIFYASSGNGTSPHLSGELFKLMTGIKMTHVPYQGSAQAMQDLIAGRTNMMFVPAPTALTQLGSSGMVALASTQLKRAGAAPNLPTMDELGLKGFDTGVWFGLYAPASTPKAIVDKLAQAANEALKSDEVRTAFKSQGIDALGSTPDEFSAYVKAEIEKWAKVVNAAGLKRQ